MDLALNKLQRLICQKAQPTKNKFSANADPTNLSLAYKSSNVAVMFSLSAYTIKRRDLSKSYAPLIV